MKLLPEKHISKLYKINFLRIVSQIHLIPEAVYIHQPTGFNQLFYFCMQRIPKGRIWVGSRLVGWWAEANLCGNTLRFFSLDWLDSSELLFLKKENKIETAILLLTLFSKAQQVSLLSLHCLLSALISKSPYTPKNYGFGTTCLLSIGHPLWMRNCLTTSLWNNFWKSKEKHLLREQYSEPSTSVVYLCNLQPAVCWILIGFKVFSLSGWN